MRVLVACEFSGIVRDAFRARGHDAWSVDLLESEAPGPHVVGDVLAWMTCGEWDLVIAHPPCTYLTRAGARWWKGREREQDEAAAFFMALYDAPAPRVCVENPAGAMTRRFRRPDQYVHPWQFGHPESKMTGLWLRGLPLLTPTDVLPARRTWDNQTPTGQNKLGPSSHRWRDRSRTYPGIAQAMAEQWGAL